MFILSLRAREAANCYASDIGGQMRRPAAGAAHPADSRPRLQSTKRLAASNGDIYQYVCVAKAFSGLVRYKSHREWKREIIENVVT